MQWGLPKGILKDIWAVVAGDEGRLTADQFLQCLYLMDNAKRVIGSEASHIKHCTGGLTVWATSPQTTCVIPVRTQQTVQD